MSLRLFLWWLLALHVGAANAAQPGAPAPVIVIFGDSLSAEYGIPRGTGWGALLSQRLARERLDYSVANLSISGETSAGGATRIDAALKQHRPAVVIVELGGNDGLRGLSLEATRANLESIVAASVRAGARVVVCGMQLPPNYGRDYTARFRALFGDIATRHKAALVPFFLEGVADRRESFQADGIHPVAEAQTRLLDNVWPALAPLLRPTKSAPKRS